ncbi:cytochrome P450 [Tepidiforma flava]|uniref:Cytochrome P450 n=1 Tax=Tepidiforma flava TaxID=3004094 RepID=A0ABY7M542_9CHLR|nr:cytochrome P450 [Tepidiforma flava]WBL35209.1 cytochrome P450 [Tepidiforma flava]
MTDTTTNEVPLGIALTPLNPEYQRDPFSLLDRVREADRVVWDEQFGRWLVARFEDVHAILNDRDLLVDPRKANEKSFNAMFRQRLLGEDREPSMLFQDPPVHTRLRGLVSKAFTPRAIERMRGRIEEIANELCDRVEGQERFDLMAAFCQPYPTIVIAEMLGVDPKDQADFKRWTDDSVAAGFDPFASEETRQKAMKAGEELQAYLRRVIAERRAEPRDDLITAMLKAEDNGDFLNDEEVLSMIGLLLAAGNVTTTDLLGNGMKNLLQHPDQRAAAAGAARTDRERGGGDAPLRGAGDVQRADSAGRPGGGGLPDAQGRFDHGGAGRSELRPAAAQGPAQVRRDAGGHRPRSLRRRAAVLPGRAAGAARGADRGAGAAEPVPDDAAGAAGAEVEAGAGLPRARGAVGRGVVSRRRG